MSWSDVDWGNAPSWLAVLAATTAAAFAGRNVLVDVRDRRQQQAQQVAAWWGLGIVAVRPSFGPQHGPGAWVRNASSLPVYGVRIEWLLDDVLWRHATQSTVPPGDEPVFVPMPSLREYRRGRADADMTWQEALAERVEAPNGSLDVSISFLDTAGRTWQRAVDGALVEVRPPRFARLRRGSSARSR